MVKSKDKEIDVQNRIRMELSDETTLTFRNNTGSLPDKTGRYVKFGLCEGSSDLIGIKAIEITPDMVGKKVGVFVALEVKLPGFNPEKIKPNTREDRQQNFIDRIKQLGGFAGFVTSQKESLLLLQDFLQALKKQ